MAKERMQKVAITLGGKQRHLLYDVNALIDLSEALGVNLMTKEGWETITGSFVFDEKEQKDVFRAVTPTFRQVRAIVWAGLRHEDESITERHVGALLDPANLSDAISAYEQAWSTQEISSEEDGKRPLEEAPASSAAHS